MKNIVLYGMRGSGKTTIGNLLAKHIGYDFYDLDDHIQNDIGMSVFDFVEANGWDAFRSKEHENLVSILQKDENKIISLGGGAITFKNNQDILLKNSDKLIYIECPIEIIYTRIKKDEKDGKKRNSLSGKGLLDELQEIYDIRRECYESYFDISVKNTSTQDACVQDIIKKIHYGRICIPIIDFELNSLKEQIEIINRSREIGIVELRIDFIKDEIINPILEIIITIRKQVILTNRNSLEGGKFEGSFKMSIDKLLSFSACGEFIDIELLAGESIHMIRHKNTIISYHNFDNTPHLDFLVEKIEEMNKYNPHAYKIAVMPKNQEDIQTIYKLQEYFNKNYPGKRNIFISMGELGKETRVNIPKMGGWITFGTLKDTSAPGQIYFQELQSLINNTTLYEYS
ncbi:type I 3-dehydroquinate dehydratase [Candidatus Gracilibacteria bacterium]|nr:type I 3-dehydroquinate dehydratase [Candidatus Gracilibacteria bacterium]